MAESRDRLLAGRYRLMHEIGRGGMGTVWWAQDEAGGREVAIKEVHLPPSLDQRERANLVRRTHREAMAAGRLRHPNLIGMYDVVVEDGRPWLVMEYVAARSLEDVFVDDGPISPARVAAIGRQLLGALGAAHAAGIVHRDVKPSNVLLEPSGRAVLTDFGIATYDGATTLTQSGSFMGSPAYVAPEVARGERATPAADLWSLGATLYAAVEGRPPYDHETAMATLSALVTALPDPPVRAGPLRPVLDGLLQKDPARRLTAGRAAAMLAEAATASAPSPGDRHGRRPVWRTGHHLAAPEGSRPGAAPRPPSAAAPRALPPAVPPGPGAAPVAPFAAASAPTASPAPFASLASPAAGDMPAGGGRRWRFLDRRGVLPAVTGVVLALAVAAGVVAGLHGWARPRADTPGDRRSPATGGPTATAGGGAPPVASSGPVPSTAGPGGVLPEMLRDPSGRPMSRKVAERGGVWPGAATVTLTVPARGRRVGLLVVCAAGAGALSFTASPVGAGRTVRGACARTGRSAAETPTFRLPAGVPHARIRVRLRPGPRAGDAGPVAWLAGVYEALGA